MPAKSTLKKALEDGIMDGYANIRKYNDILKERELNQIEVDDMRKSEIELDVYLKIQKVCELRGRY